MRRIFRLLSEGAFSETPIYFFRLLSEGSSPDEPNSFFHAVFLFGCSGEQPSDCGNFFFRLSEGASPDAPNFFVGVSYCRRKLKWWFKAKVQSR